MNTVWFYVDISKRVGDLEFLKVFGRRDAAEEWLALHDPQALLTSIRSLESLA
jgi:hypothetical protein